MTQKVTKYQWHFKLSLNLLNHFSGTATVQFFEISLPPSASELSNNLACTRNI